MPHPGSPSPPRPGALLSSPLGHLLPASPHHRPSVLATLCLPCTRFVPAPGPLHRLFSWPGAPLLQSVTASRLSAQLSLLKEASRKMLMRPCPSPLPPQCLFLRILSSKTISPCFLSLTSSSDVCPVRAALRPPPPACCEPRTALATQEIRAALLDERLPACTAAIFL